LTGMPMTAAKALSPSAWARLHLSPATDAIVCRALAPNSAARFLTADALRVAAEGALSQIAMGSSQPDRLRDLSGRGTAHAGDDSPRIGLAGLFRARSTRQAS
ncbi:MAG: hypothetical protein LC748_08050, partial [Thermomicrobia bacterium]|nr:hypothetical protein [Thermomicrobia bacterium]